MVTYRGVEITGNSGEYFCFVNGVQFGPFESFQAAQDFIDRARLIERASERDEYNRDLLLRARNGQIGSGMKFRG